MPQTEFINPNFHVALVHFPLAMLIAGTLIELFGFMWRQSGFRSAGRWMILLGALTAIPTTLSGVYAMRDVATRGLEPAQTSGPWNEVASRSLLSSHQWEMLKDHAWLQIGSTALAVLVSITWIACSDRARAKLHWLFMLVLLIAAWMTMAGAWHGGELVFAHGTGVSSDQNEQPHIHAPTTEPTTRAATSTAATTQSEPRFTIGTATRFFFPPVQLHITLAGATIAIALAALGLSIRKITQGIPSTQVDHIAAALGSDAPDTLAAEPQDVGVPRVPAARFWMLTLLVTLLTAGAGYWMLALHEYTASVNDLWKQFIAENMRNNQLRQVAHLIAGGSIAVLALILAMLARWGPRQKFLLFIFALLLIGVVGAQVWFGILLLYDTRMGPLTKFN